MILKQWTRLDWDSTQADLKNGQEWQPQQNIKQNLETMMGEAKRRKEQLGEKYGKENSTFSWLPIPKIQTEQFMKWTTRGTWIGIGVVAACWITIRFIGPSLGWWSVN